MLQSSEHKVSFAPFGHLRKYKFNSASEQSAQEATPTAEVTLSGGRAGADSSARTGGEPVQSKHYLGLPISIDDALYSRSKRKLMKSYDESISLISAADDSYTTSAPNFQSLLKQTRDDEAIGSASFVPLSDRNEGGAVGAAADNATNSRTENILEEVPKFESSGGKRKRNRPNK